MTDRTGILKNSPLVFVLASVRFLPWQMMAKKIDEIHDVLRDTAPLIQELRIQPIDMPSQFSKTSAEALIGAWVFMSNDRSLGIHLSQDQLLVFTKKYENYKHFEDVISKCLEVLLKHMRFMDISNMGVRFIDRIQLKASEKHSDYVTEKFLPSDVEGFNSTGGIIFGTYKDKDMCLRVRSITQPDALYLPEDMFNLAALTQDPTKPIEIKFLTEKQFILDMDAIKQFPVTSRMQERKDILDQLNQLHSLANKFFRHQEFCTDYAFKTWRGESDS